MIIYMVLGIINPAGASENGEDKLPFFLRFLKAASPIRWAIESLCCGEFRGMKLTRERGLAMGGLMGVRSGDAVLDALGLGKKEWMDGVRNLAFVGLIELGVASVASYFTQPVSSKSARVARKKANTATNNIRAGGSSGGKEQRIKRVPPKFT